MPKDQADDLNMDDEVDAEDDEEVEFLPQLDVAVRPQAKEDVSSLQREETSQQTGDSVQPERPMLEIRSGQTPEERYGMHVVGQLTPEYQELLRDLAFNSQQLLTGDDREGRPPMRRDQISFFGTVFMMEYMVDESHSSFMDIFVPSTHTDITDEKYHEFRLALKKVKEENQYLGPDNFEDVEEPDLMDDDPNIPLQRREDQGRGDPEFKGAIENLSRENKHIILETEDAVLIECAVQWLSMYHKTIQKKIMERVVKKEEEEEEKDAKVEEDQEEPPEPTVPAPTMIISSRRARRSCTNGLRSHGYEPKGNVQSERRVSNFVRSDDQSLSQNGRAILAI